MGADGESHRRLCAFVAVIGERGVRVEGAGVSRGLGFGWVGAFYLPWVVKKSGSSVKNGSSVNLSPSA